MTRKEFFKKSGMIACASAIGSVNTMANGVEAKNLSYAMSTGESGATAAQQNRPRPKVKITVLRRECYKDLQEQYLSDPKSGPCTLFHDGQEFLVEGNDFFKLMHGNFCAEAWDCISRYVYAALQGGSIMRGWTNDERMMIACCNDGTRPVIFKIERIDP